ncbi:MAG: alpha/beta hydrolase [Erysipelotrichaceae bacterium]|nr:alpha/beta hydrolase [Erysipelotrichaceae bacterium]
MFKWIINRTINKMRRDWKKGDDIRDKGLTDPDNVEIIDNINYGDGSVNNLLTLHRAKIKGLLPVIVDIHGGGYFYGDKERYHYYCSELASYGFAVINFNYHLAPDWMFPKPLEDTALVFKWMTENAKEYRLDINNVFIVGDSAGAQLTSQYAAILSNPEYEKLFDFEVNKNFTVQAIVCNCGMYDILNDPSNKRLSFYYGKDFNNRSSRLDVLKYINSNYPPTLVMTSNGDFLKDNGEPFAKYLNSKGVENEYHYYDPNNKQLEHVFHIAIRTEEAIQCNDRECQFMKEHLNKRVK